MVRQKAAKGKKAKKKSTPQKNGNPTPPHQRTPGLLQRITAANGDEVEDSYAGRSRGNGKFSMADEARNTDRHNTRSTGFPLRRTAVAFVSAGTLKSTIGNDDDDENEAEKVGATDAEQSTRDEATFFTDTAGDLSLATATTSKPNIQTMLQRSTPQLASSSSSSSSDEEVVFVPRGQRGKAVPPVQLEKKLNDPGVTTVERITVVEETFSQVTISKAASPPPAPEFQSPPEPRNIAPRSRNQRRKRPSLFDDNDDDDMDDEIIADFISNTRENGMDEDLHQMTHRDLGGDDYMPEKSSDEEPSGLEDGTTSQLESEDESYPIVLEGGALVLYDKRYGADGVQYLVQWAGNDMEEPAWLSEDIIASVLPPASDSQPSAESEQTEIGATWKDVYNSKIAAGNEPGMDEIFARALQAQEDAAMKTPGQNSVMQDELEESDQSDPVESLLRYIAKNGSSNGKYPKASAMADAFDELEYMDYSHKSAGRSKKNHAPNFDLSDSSEEERLGEQWRKDKATKHQKKLEREELRKSGGFNAGGKIDLKKKYARGMSMSDVHMELKVFLLSDVESLTLVPMEKNERKQVHNQAAQFYLKSKSMGAGNNRYPVLYKTKRSKHFRSNESAIEEILTGSKFGRFNNMHSTGRGAKVARRGGGTGHRPMEGDVVGSGAAELGEQNRGRLMLEKMGWSSGTALGTMENKGILVPVAAVMKSSRIGLG